MLVEIKKERWCNISDQILGRSDNTIKNVYHSLVKLESAFYWSQLTAKLEIDTEASANPQMQAQDACADPGVPQHEKLQDKLLDHYQRSAQAQYLRHIECKITKLQEKAAILSGEDLATNLFVRQYCTRAITPNYLRETKKNE